MRVKGVSKCVLEVHELDNDYFEKAIFFVKPEYSGVVENRLRVSAKGALRRAMPPKLKAQERKQKRLSLLYASIGAVCGAVVTGILSVLL